MDIFELLNERYKLPNKPKLFEAFSGIGCQRMAFNRLRLDYESVGISEIDKYAIQSYAAIHTDFLEYRDKLLSNVSKSELKGNKLKKQLDKKASEYAKNFGSICDIKGTDLPQIDVFTWSFPCTDLSKAGKQKGLDGTRSGLVYEVLRIMQECKVNGNLPKVLIMENVVDLIQVKFIREFQAIQLELENLGYTNYTQTLNAKDYGVAQNRDRVFMVSILGDYYYEFPKPIKLEKRLKDYLESEVDPKYYLSDKLLNCFTDMTNRNGLVRGDRFNPHDLDKSKYAFAITTMDGNRATDNFIKEYKQVIPFGSYYTWKDNQGNINTQCNRAVDEDGIALTVACAETGKVILKEEINDFIKIPEATIKGYTEAYDGDGVYINRPHQKRGVVQDGMIQTLKTSCADVGVVVYDDYNQQIRNDQNTIGTLTTNCGSSAERNGFKIIENGLRIRKLTEKECWRLMGINDEDFNKASKVCSRSQLYRQSGNGIVVDVFASILSTMKGESC